MAPKKDKDVAALKGKDAEEAILAYIKKVNRPYGSSDISANMKNAVSKLAAQKVLQQMADEGKITQKTYGKATIFVAKQEGLETLSADQMKEMHAELARLKDKLRELNDRVKLGLERELIAIRQEPTDEELEQQIDMAEAQVNKLRKELEPLRAQAPSATPEEMNKIDDDWNKWRAEWKARRKVFQDLFSAVTDSHTREDKDKLQEDLGLEFDSEEHIALEKSPLGMASVRPLKPVKRARK
ncbi:TBPIP-domain-containing protein [Calocera cornea HHB12733]|uniref:TBPIP-domain-containing protein n=1 Tax=Calocera cornea HHB12733 TaxID=1353952 RepID=A0A165DPQ0_9BASI|nr:TBPIP-domain-containing protein [Calocera cornea HHB12733]